MSDEQQGELIREEKFSGDIIFNDVCEATEREKHKRCIMLRGFNCNSVNICDKFKEVSQILNVGFVDLSDVVKIDNKKLFRAKVLNDDKCRNLNNERL